MLLSCQTAGNWCLPQFLNKAQVGFWALQKSLPLLPISHWKLPSSLGWWNRAGNTDTSHREPGIARVRRRRMREGQEQGRAGSEGLFHFCAKVPL